jgi:hypothetical protein
LVIALLELGTRAFKMVKLPQYEVLNFCFDNNNGCSLTVLTNDERFHITVAPKHFQDRSKKGKEIQRAYRRLLQRARTADQDGEEAQEGSQSDEEDNDSDDNDTERDSAVDVSTPEQDQHPEKEDKELDPTTALHRWILTPLIERLPTQSSLSKVTLQDWYHTSVHFYNLSTAEGKLEANEDQSPPKSLTERINEVLIPIISIPKKTLNLSIPQFSASDLTVLSCAADPAPYHPILVSHHDEKLFLKPVDPTQPGPTIREIHLLHSIADKGLHSRDDFRCPQLRGLVHFSESTSSKTSSERKNIAALLLTPIDDPTPLTHLLDPSTPEHKRTQWAKDAERMVEVLHENELIWGDAKGDNFLVDGKDEKVWMIDFGGSWTEGWVDEKLKETEEGDWQGTEKVLNALNDPVNGTMSEEEEAEVGKEEVDEEKGEADEAGDEADKADESGEVEEAAENVKEPESSRKRSHDSTTEHDTDQAPAPKQQKLSRQRGYTEDTKYCYCDSVSSGRMLACDGEQCKREWFHFDCLGIDEAPEDKEWFCEECRET